MCRSNFDDSDPKEDKGLFMACCSACEEWFDQKCVEMKGKCFWTSPQKMEISFML